MTWDTRWGSVSSNQRREKKRKENIAQRQFLINSSDNDSNDEEWIQQLERDYGKRQLKKTKWTRLEKLLLAALGCTLIFVSVLLTAMFYSRYKHGETLLEFTLGGQKFCNEKGCVEASHRVFTYMSDALDPCDSFYDHACGSWLKNEILPPTHTKWTSFGQASDHNQRKLKSILDRLEKGTENSLALRKVRQYYKACLRKDFIESHGNETLIALINDVGSWSLTNRSTWNEEQWNFDHSLSKIHHLKSMPLFYMYVAPDDKNSSRNVIQIEQSGVTLSDESIYRRPAEDKIVKAYKKLMINVGLLLGAEKESTKKQMDEIFEFEKKLSEIYEDRERLQQADQIYHKMNIEELQRLCPAIPWLDYLNSMFTAPVKSSEPVIVYTPNYFKNMSDLVIRTERRIIANYMVWHLIKPILPLLSQQYRSAAIELASKETGMQGSQDSWKNCVTKTDSVLGFATGYLFVREMENEGKYMKHEVNEMLQTIKEEFISNLHSVKWMDDVTKKRAVQKATSIINMIGYPEWVKSIGKLDKYYDGLEISDNPLSNFLNARQFYHEKTMQRRGKAVQRDEWHMAPTEVNAYYNSPNNYIAFPAGILQPPFFDHGYPISVNFGSLGFVMGHELTHGFDSQGRHYDQFGNMIKWWTNATTKAFLNRTKCLENQYAAFGSKTKAKQTLAENIADNGGLKIAYNAFKATEYLHGADKLLPGFKLTPDQLFFLGFAQTWCTLATQEKKEQSGQLSIHSNEKTRVDIVLSNSKEFAKAYNCPVGSKMNPAKKCNIW